VSIMRTSTVVVEGGIDSAGGFAGAAFGDMFDVVFLIVVPRDSDFVELMLLRDTSLADDPVINSADLVWYTWKLSHSGHEVGNALPYSVPYNCAHFHV
jgi:hypothetical protein